MKGRFLIATCLCAAMTAHAAPRAPGVEKPPPSATEILDKVVAAMPGEPILITGKLALKNRSLTTIRSLLVRARIHITPAGASGVYSIQDAFGNPLEELSVSRERGKKPVAKYRRGDPPANADAPDIFSPIQETHLTWSDLTMPFLWWRTARVVDTGSAKGRDCDIIEIIPPAGETEHNGAVRVWIDRQYNILLRADEHDKNGRLLRRMAVQSFKKIGDDWMIKDIVMERAGSREKSVLTILEMRPVETASPGSSSPDDSEP